MKCLNLVLILVVVLGGVGCGKWVLVGLVVSMGVLSGVGGIVGVEGDVSVCGICIYFLFYLGLSVVEDFYIDFVGGDFM